jgi:3-(3-hydroxy-phenyl)propionate hydroxylase
MSALDADVIVAGAGPVGLSLAAALALAGRSVHVLEAAADLSDEARASTLHPPTLEMFAEWGIIDEVLARGRAIDRLQYWERATRSLVAEFPYSLLAGVTRFPYRLQCPQSVVTRVLRDRILRSPRARLSMGHEVVAFAEDGDGVAVRARTFEGERVLRARFLVGADGSKSRVREALGLGFTGTTYPDRFLLVATDIDFAASFVGMGPVAYVFDPDEWVIVMQLPDLVRVVFRLAPSDDGDLLSEGSIRARMGRFLGEEAAFAIKGAWIYAVHQRVTDRFRVGRVVLAGDAAHINNPAGGMGMNSGVHDAHHLARALDDALGGGGDAALERYARERRDVAVRGVQESSDRNYRLLVARDPEARAARDRELREAASDRAKARAYLLRASMMAGAGAEG